MRIASSGVKPYILTMAPTPQHNLLRHGFLFCFVLFCLAKLHCMWDLSSWPGNWTCTPCSGSSESTPGPLGKSYHGFSDFILTVTPANLASASQVSLPSPNPPGTFPLQGLYSVLSSAWIFFSRCPRSCLPPRLLHVFDWMPLSQDLPCLPYLKWHFS